MKQTDQRNAISHLVFDMGGVLVQIDWHGRMSALLGRSIPFEQIHSLWGASHAVTEFESGRLSFDAFTTAFIREQQLKIGAEEFQQQFMAILQADMPGIVELLARLKPHYTLCLLSNTNPAHLTALQQRNTFLAQIDLPFTSLDFGVMKPDPAIYQALLAELPCAPHNILFFDDGAANVAAARQAGLHAVQVCDTQGIERALQSYNLL